MPPAVIGGALALGGAAIGGVSSNNAANKAADASKKGIEATQEAARQARNDAINLFSRGMQSAQSGIGGALNFYQNNATAKVQPFVQGNIAAQQVLGQGANQANNAILGLPVDMSFANKPQSLATDYSGISTAQLPALGGHSQLGPDVPPNAQGVNQDPTGLKTLLAKSEVAPTPSGSKSAVLGKAIGAASGSGALGNLVSRLG